MSLENKKKNRLTPVSVLHFIRLTYRSILFIVFVIIYIDWRVNIISAMDLPVEFLADLSQSPTARTVVLDLVWTVYMVEMLMRFFPSRFESPGSQKQFARNYIKSGKTSIEVPDNNGTMLSALLWVSFNAIFGAFYLAGILDDGIMIILSCAFAVCDMICILFFCPFQSWILKNKCCGSCRIYNWDYAMMFTPLFFVRSIYTWSLLFMSLALLFRWEFTFYRHPERFSEQTNLYLKCSNCTEKLCAHKKQLHSLWKEISAFTKARTKQLQKEEES